VYLHIPPRPDCTSAWVTAATAVEAQEGHEARNVIIDVAEPTAGACLSHPVVARVNEFLLARDKSVETIANTIFPQALYQRHGLPGFIDVFHNQVLPKVAKTERWSGYYFERMTGWPGVGKVEPVDQLTRMVGRMRDPGNKSLHKHEMVLFDPLRDVDNSPYGGQCLSFLSFHLEPNGPQGRRTLRVTALYRNHFYMEKLLGNLIGLGRLMAFVAAESGTAVGPLTVVSTHAEVDTMKASRFEIRRLLADCAALCESGGLQPTGT
jgi:hypothetical protein